MTPEKITECVKKIIETHCKKCKDTTRCVCPDIAGMLKSQIGSLDDLNAIITEWRRVYKNE